MVATYFIHEDVADLVSGDIANHHCSKFKLMQRCFVLVLFQPLSIVAVPLMLYVNSCQELLMSSTDFFELLLDLLILQLSSLKHFTLSALLWD